MNFHDSTEKNGSAAWSNLLALLTFSPLKIFCELGQSSASTVSRERPVVRGGSSTSWLIVITLNFNLTSLNDDDRRARTPRVANYVTRKLHVNQCCYLRLNPFRFKFCAIKSSPSSRSGTVCNVLIKIHLHTPPRTQECWLAASWQGSLEQVLVNNKKKKMRKVTTGSV